MTRGLRGLSAANAGWHLVLFSPHPIAPSVSYDVPLRELTKRFELRDPTGTLSTANGATQVDYRAVQR